VAVILQRRKGLAIAGLVISGLFGLALLVVGAIVFCSA